MSSPIEPEITPEMKARYVTRREADVANLEKALTENDFKTIANIAHQIKGNAATFSFTDLEAIAVALERAAQSSARDACHVQITAIRAWLKAHA